jgi:hypothetical protein
MSATRNSERSRNINGKHDDRQKGECFAGNAGLKE